MKAGVTFFELKLVNSGLTMSENNMNEIAATRSRDSP
jgi:hypothetical protein